MSALVIVNIYVFSERFMSQAPYLMHENSITPHIASSGVLLVVESLCVEICIHSSFLQLSLHVADLRCSPFDWDLPTM